MDKLLKFFSDIKGPDGSENNEAAATGKQLVGNQKASGAVTRTTVGSAAPFMEGRDSRSNQEAGRDATLKTSRDTFLDMGTVRKKEWKSELYGTGTKTAANTETRSATLG